MNKPINWDIKNLILVLGFLGFTSAGSLFTFGRTVLGWFTLPTIEKAQALALSRQDSAWAIRFDSLSAWHRENRQAIKALAGKVDTLSATVADMPGAPAAARRRIQRERQKRDMLGSRGLADDRSSFRSLKGEVIP